MKNHRLGDLNNRNLLLMSFGVNFCQLFCFVGTLWAVSSRNSCPLLQEYFLYWFFECISPISYLFFSRIPTCQLLTLLSPSRWILRFTYIFSCVFCFLNFFFQFLRDFFNLCLLILLLIFYMSDIKILISSIMFLLFIASNSCFMITIFSHPLEFFHLFFLNFLYHLFSFQVP